MAMMNDSLLADLSDAATGNPVGDTPLYFGLNENATDTGDLMILDGDKVEALKLRVVNAGFVLKGGVQATEVGPAVAAADDEASLSSQDD